MTDEWVNVDSERNPKFEHIHANGSRHASDRTIPMLTVETATPRYWKARFVCRDCNAALEQSWRA